MVARPPIATYALLAFDAADSVFILEYPGYGSARASRRARASTLPRAKGTRTLRARFPGTPVCVAAESIGSGPASVLSAEQPAPDKIVYVVPFDTLVIGGESEHMS